MSKFKEILDNIDRQYVIIEECWVARRNMIDLMVRRAEHYPNWQWNDVANFAYNHTAEEIMVRGGGWVTWGQQRPKVHEIMKRMNGESTMEKGVLKCHNTILQLCTQLSIEVSNVQSQLSTSTSQGGALASQKASLGQQNAALPVQIATKEQECREKQKYISDANMSKTALTMQHTDAIKSKQELVDGLNPKQVSFLLQKSIENADVDTVKLIGHLDFDVNFQNSTREGLIHTAIRKNDSVLLKTIMDKSPNLDLCDNDGNTPLHLALQHDMAELATEVVELGANIYLKNKSGQTAFDLAAEHPDLLKIMQDREKIDQDASAISPTIDDQGHELNPIGDHEEMPAEHL